VRTYKVTLEVDYIIKASSLNEAMKLAIEDSEHPLVGGTETGYCDAVRAVSGAIDSEPPTHISR
jgi:vacuolar-type H+-ATPase subunit B/Vma2